MVSGRARRGGPARPGSVRPGSRERTAGRTEPGWGRAARRGGGGRGQGLGTRGAAGVTPRGSRERVVGAQVTGN